MLKVLKGSLVVIKGVRRNDLYALEDVVVFGPVSTTEKIVLSKTKIWPIRLGHLSEKGLVELEK